MIVGNQVKEGASKLIGGQTSQGPFSPPWRFAGARLSLDAISARQGVTAQPSYRYSVIIFFGIYPFLAVTHRVDADILVVEGWIGPYAIQFAAKEFNSHR